MLFRAQLHSQRISSLFSKNFRRAERLARFISHGHQNSAQMKLLITATDDLRIQHCLAFTGTEISCRRTMLFPVADYLRTRLTHSVLKINLAAATTEFGVSYLWRSGRSPCRKRNSMKRARRGELTLHHLHNTSK